MIDFDKLKINCSQLGSLMGDAKGNRLPTESEIKKLFNILGRQYGELTESMKEVAREILLKPIYYEPRRPSDKILSELIVIYSYEMYGKSKLTQGGSVPYAAEKGLTAESDAIELISRIDQSEYVKNENLFDNKWFKGVPDVIVRSNNKVQKIIEVKVSYDLPSFIMAMSRPEPARNLFEIMGYMDLLECKNGEIIHCLVDMPHTLASAEERRLKERHKVLDLDESYSSDRILSVLNSMQYSEIPDELKVFRRSVTYNKLTMKEAKVRVGHARKWLKEIHNSFTKGTLLLVNNEEGSL